MATNGRKRRMGSLAKELTAKSREAALSAVQVYNNPNITFKSETFIVLMVIAWTYLMHAYYRRSGVEYRYYKQGPQRRVFDRTKRGAYKYWELERCLNDLDCPFDQGTKNNLRFLIGLRHEIEHQMSSNLDNHLSARYQACALNYCRHLKDLFGDGEGIDQHLMYSIQFNQLSRDQLSNQPDGADLPDRLRAYVAEFDASLNADELSDERFAYRLYFLRRTVNHPGAADRVIEFISPESEAAQDFEKQLWTIKDRERPKYLPNHIVKLMNEEGYPRFRTHDHTTLWQNHDGKHTGQGFGVQIHKQWYWYESWLDIVREHCSSNRGRYV